MGRVYIYDSTMNRLPASGTIGVNDLASTSRTCFGDATSRQQRLGCFDFVLGSQYERLVPTSGRRPPLHYPKPNPKPGPHRHPDQGT